MSPSAPAPSLAEICRVLNLSEQAQTLLDERVSPETYLNRLAAKDLNADAFRVLAGMMLPREAVWWGCLCAWHVGRPELPAAQAATLQAVVRWVQDPSEVNRRSAGIAGEAAGGPSTVAGGLALAVFCSAGSLAPAGLPAVSPPPGLAAEIIARTLILAATSPEPAQTRMRSRQFLSYGLSVARGKITWT